MVKEMLTKVIDTVDKSVRKYDNLRLIILPYMLPDFLHIWNSIYQKVSPNIFSLELDFKQVPDQSIVILLATTIEMMLNLQSLSICFLSGPHSFVDIRHFSMQHVKLHSTNYIAVDMPQLESFEGPLDALKKPYPTSQPLVLTKLKHVTLTFGPDNLDGPSIIHRLAQAETMKLMFRLTADLFLAICEACTALKELYFWHVTVSDRATTRNLSQLVNLRQLTFHTISIEGQGSFNLDLDLRELNQLEELDIGSIDLGVTSILYLPVSMRVLTVRISAQNEESIIHSIASCSPRLQKLRLVYDASNNTEVNWYTMKCPNLFERLEELEFVNALFSEAVFIAMSDPMYRLYQLRFENTNLNVEHIKKLKEMFGNWTKVDAFNDKIESIPTTVEELVAEEN
ncbi:uncharacterized protein LOC126577974 isoform X1 [Anopheles aquasalis]|uniref:uncharacterized protein LOC126577974 isoform X1 n=1 Tax=Anopheles aquasalis TaxID=42839 RepID=UPI00215AF978|nr:uncharacterized protein LOC126577974 isoform X1 [Anopheles aquasalis]